MLFCHFYQGEGGNFGGFLFASQNDVAIQNGVYGSKFFFARIEPLPNERKTKELLPL